MGLASDGLLAIAGEGVRRHVAADPVLAMSKFWA